MKKRHRVLAEAETDARVLAGGTDLVVDMKTGRMRPSTVVNLKRIPDLTGIEDVDGSTRIGALTKVDAVGRKAQRLHALALLVQRCGGKVRRLLW